MELSNPRAEIFALGDGFKYTGVPTLTTSVDDVVTPPVQLDLGELEEEEDDDGRDGDGAAEGGREHEVVFGPEAEVVSLEINPGIPADRHGGPYVGYVIGAPLANF